MTLNRVWMPSPNKSSRVGNKVRLIVLHTTEGASTIESLGSYFGSTSVQASSHVGVDDKVNTVGEYVKRADKAWTSANANPVAVQAELCAWASWTPMEWSKHPNMLANCAAWIAEEAAFYGIPIVALTPSQAQGNLAGVCQHSDLGAWGGGHHDCGAGFPIGQVIDMALGSSGPTTGGGAVEICATKSGKGYWICGSDGGVFTYGDAGFFGSLGDTKLDAPIIGMAATPSNQGYWLLGQDGGVFTFGDAAFYGAPTGVIK